MEGLELADTLNIYKGSQLLKSGTSPVHVDLADAKYPAGTFKGEIVNAAGEKTAKFDFPAVTIGASDAKPTEANTVAEITAWLDAHSIAHTGKTTKADLLALVPQG